MKWESLYSQAKQWVNEAGERIRQSFNQRLSIQTKSNANDLVTNIDKETEQFFIKKIKEAYPHHKIMGEEGFGDKLDSLKGIVWMIDPIDGTMNFIHQQRNFAISIGVYEDGVGKIGLVYDVVHDELYHAFSGKGAYLNETPIANLSETAVNKSIIALNATWVMKNHRIDHNLLIPLVRDARGTRSYGSAALEMVFVATGRVDAYISMRLSPWDYAAGAVIIEELGGVVTNLRGEKLDYLTQDSLFVAKPGLHQTILQEYLKDGKW
ncbi:MULTISPECIES: inositol monophosphatase family protein [Neobacillus]|uniref:inositol-phosphate phosphatase n=1 Tax=Neobacillus rhizophilus TaxID=2833579 RepID=A0A942U442_9BACI|nr:MULTISPECIES: inositol monophosphatase family protein [Neobacillus]MBS4211997.1 inositol monophosphatase family protein [Neobacillus rhizophilus]MBU8915428.1 inositol monophosphatase family protein [Bacillus sp. FJAT-29953]